MACARRDLDRVRHPAAAGAWHCADPRVPAEYLRVRPCGTLTLASRSQPVRAVGKFPSDQLYPWFGELRISQTLYRRIEFGRHTLQLCLLDQSTPRLLSLVGGQGRGSRLAGDERATMVGRSRRGGTAVELEPRLR